jgi:NAD-dependent dihydropyrimidine dehydrogenase PreA subunit
MGDDSILLVHEIYYESYINPRITRDFLFHALNIQNKLRIRIPQKDFLMDLLVCFYTREELKNILESNGFKVMAAAAFIGEHSFSRTLSKNRPDDKDMAIVNDFADQVYKKLIGPDCTKPVFVPGNQPLGNYYQPKSANGDPIDIRKVTPKTIIEECTDCKLCVHVCPMGSIDEDDVTKLNGICIKCGACIKKCPTEAKYFDDPGFLEHKEDIEIKFASRREPELFLS